MRFLNTIRSQLAPSTVEREIINLDAGEKRDEFYGVLVGRRCVGVENGEIRWGEIGVGVGEVRMP